MSRIIFLIAVAGVLLGFTAIPAESRGQASPPNNFHVTGTSDGSVSLDWNGYGHGVKGYRLYRYVGDVLEDVTDTQNTITERTVTALSNGTEYGFELTAYSSSWETRHTARVFATPSGPTPTPTPTPTETPTPSPTPTPTETPTPTPTETPTPTPTPTETPTPTPTPTPDPNPSVCNDTADWSYGFPNWTSTGKVWPDGGDQWRPFAASSPFNQCVPDAPPLDQNSATKITRLRVFGNPQNMLSLPANGQDWQHPFYIADASRDSRVLTIHCTKYSEGCSGIEGLQVRVPSGAQFASGSDQHIGIGEYLLGRMRIVDIYNAGISGSIPASGTWNVGAGSVHWLDGSGIQMNTIVGATAAGFSTEVGMVRGQDFQRGTLEHVLFGVLKCTSGSVYPTVRKPDADGVIGSGDQDGSAEWDYRLARQCTQTGDPMDGPKLGDWVHLNMTDAEIDALRYTSGATLHPSAKVYLRALRDRGMVFGDTGGTEFGKPEGGISYTTMGANPPLDTVGDIEGWPTTSNGYRYLPISQLPWATLFDHMEVIDHCVTDPSC